MSPGEIKFIVFYVSHSELQHNVTTKWGNGQRDDHSPDVPAVPSSYPCDKLGKFIITDTDTRDTN